MWPSSSPCLGDVTLSPAFQKLIRDFAAILASEGELHLQQTTSRKPAKTATRFCHETFTEGVDGSASRRHALGIQRDYVARHREATIWKDWWDLSSPRDRLFRSCDRVPCTWQPRGVLLVPFDIEWLAEELDLHWSVKIPASTPSRSASMQNMGPHPTPSPRSLCMSPRDYDSPCKNMARKTSQCRPRT